MRILVATPDAYGGHGGMSQYNRDFIEALCDAPGVEQTVVLPRVMLQPPGSWPASVDFDTRGLGGRVSYTGAVARRALSRDRYGLVVCGHVNLLPLAYAAARARRCPIMLLTYGVEAWTPSRSRIANALSQQVDQIVSISRFTKDKMAGWCPKASSAAIVPNTIDLARFTPGPPPPELVARYGLSDKKVLMTLGRLVERERHKGFDEVLEVMPRLIAAHPDLVYLIVGDGPGRQRLEETVARLDLGRHVRFAGLIAESEKVEHYRLADAFAMPSRGEGFGFVFLEAMGCGVPVVASNADGSREAVRDGMLGAMVDPGDSEALFDAIHCLLAKPSKAVPEGLDFFAFPNFRDAVHTALRRTLTRGGDHGA